MKPAQMASRPARLALGLASIAACGLIFAFAVATAQDCASCKPPLNSEVENISGEYKVCIETTLPNSSNPQDPHAFGADERNGLKEGIEQYWGAYFGEASIPVSFEFSFAEHNQCGTHDIKIGMEEGFSANNNGLWAGVVPTSNGRQTHIRIDPSNNGVYGKDVWKNLGAHELGHVLGFHHCAENCTSFSVMTPTISTTWQSSLRCGDLGAVAQRFPSDPGGTTEEDVPGDPGEGEQCWDRYEVTYVYTWVGNGWQLTDVIYQYLYTWCEPLEDG